MSSLSCSQVQSGSALAEAMILETEAAVMANFEFLSQADVEMDEDDDICDELDDSQDIEEQEEMRTTKRKQRPKVILILDKLSFLTLSVL